MLIVSRMVLGGCVHTLWETLFILVQETTPPQHRTVTSALVNISWSAGTLILVLLAHFIRDWRHLQLAFFIFSLTSVVFFFLVIESPRWLLVSGRADEAVDAVMRIAKINGVHLSEEDIQKSFSNLAKEDELSSKKTLFDQLREMISKLRMMFSGREVTIQTVLLIIAIFSVGMGSYGMDFSSKFSNMSIFQTVAMNASFGMGTILLLTVLLKFVSRIFTKTKS